MNHLDEADFEKKEIKAILKALRELMVVHARQHADFRLECECQTAA